MKNQARKNKAPMVYLILSMVYARSPLRDFESYPEVLVGLDEKEI